jgi:hypothetical protein
MKFRKLRITWTVCCGIACMLLVVLWVRSYWRTDVVWKHNGRNTYMISSRSSGIMLVTLPGKEGTFNWSYETRASNNTRSPVRTPTYSMWGFQYKDETDTLAKILFVPSWFTFLLLAALTVVTSPWKLVSCRFSLRTLLIAITAIGVMLGLIVWAVR